MLAALGEFAGKEVAAGLDGAEDAVAEVGADDLGLVFYWGGRVEGADGESFREGGAFGRGGGCWGVGARVVWRGRNVMESLGYEALGKAAVGEREGGEHDLAGGVVEVGVGDERAEAEDLAGAVFGGGKASILEEGGC